MDPGWRISTRDQRFELADRSRYQPGLLEEPSEPHVGFQIPWSQDHPKQRAVRRDAAQLAEQAFEQLGFEDDRLAKLFSGLLRPPSRQQSMSEGDSDERRLGRLLCRGLQQRKGAARRLAGKPGDLGKPVHGPALFDFEREHPQQRFSRVAYGSSAIAAPAKREV